MVWLLWLLAGCPGPRTKCDLDRSLSRVVERWPTARAALDAHDVYGLGAVWFWSHGRASVDGFGPTLVLVDKKPSPLALFDRVGDVPAGYRLDHPSLLFFDQTDGPPDTWPLVGVGWHFHFDPCARPRVRCVDEGEVWVHEAGYHRIPAGDGGMTVATGDDLVSGHLDADGCVDVHQEDLVASLGWIAHGRAWTVHAWLPPDASEAATVALEDPWKRWEDAPNRVAIEGRAFFQQGDCPCVADSAPVDSVPEPRGCQ